MRLKIGEVWTLDCLGDVGARNWSGCESTLSSRQVAFVLNGW